MRSFAPPETTSLFVILIPIIAGQVLHATRAPCAAHDPKFRSALPRRLFTPETVNRSRFPKLHSGPSHPAVTPLSERRTTLTDTSGALHSSHGGNARTDPANKEIGFRSQHDPFMMLVLAANEFAGFDVARCPGHPRERSPQHGQPAETLLQYWSVHPSSNRIMWGNAARPEPTVT